jgi:protein gp37
MLHRHWDPSVPEPSPSENLNSRVSVIGCTRVSPGCDRCYAIPLAHMHASNPNAAVAAASAGTTWRTEAGTDWTGHVRLLSERLTEPLTWTKPRKVFVNSQADLWHAQVPADFIARTFAVMALAARHQFQVLTKRPARMRSLLASSAFADAVDSALTDIARHKGLRPAAVQDARRALERPGGGAMPPLANVWLGVSVEDQKRADQRIPILLDTPAAVRWVSAEPLLGPVDLRRAALHGRGTDARPDHAAATPLHGLHWVVVGGETGRGSSVRPMHPAWPLGLLQQCRRDGIPMQFKQWGSWAPGPWAEPHRFETRLVLPDGSTAPDATSTTAALMIRCGKHLAGRLLDGAVIHEWPAGHN